MQFLVPDLLHVSDDGTAYKFSSKENGQLICHTTKEHILTA
jgi:hypothetical protein